MCIYEYKVCYHVFIGTCRPGPQAPRGTWGWPPPRLMDDPSCPLLEDGL